MNGFELATVLLETDDFDPKDYGVPGGVESGDEIYQDDYVRIFEPKTAQTFNDLMGSENKSRRMNMTPATFKEHLLSGRMYVIIPKSTQQMPTHHTDDKGDLVQSEADKYGPIALRLGRNIEAWDPFGHTYDKIGQIQNELGPDAYASAITALTNYFVTRAKGKQGAREAIRNLLIMGKYAEAVKHGRYHLPHIKDMAVGHSIGAALAMQASGKRPGNRITRFMRNQQDVKFTDHGFYLLFPDWEEVVKVALKTDHSRFDVESTAKGALEGQMDWLDPQVPDVDDLVRHIDEPNMKTIRRKLIGRTYNDEETGEDVLIDEGVARSLTDGEIEEILKRDDYSEFDDIVNAIRWAGQDAERAGIENAYYKAYLGLVEDALGKHSEIDGQHAFFFPYSELDKWVREEEAALGEDFYMENLDIHSLAAEHIEKSVPPEDISHDWDQQYFNDSLRDYHLHEIEDRDVLPIEAEPQDPQQQQMDLGDPRREERPVNELVKLTIYNADGTANRQIELPRLEAEEYVKANPNAHIEND